jgi:hypothetical protein
LQARCIRKLFGHKFYISSLKNSKDSMPNQSS